MQMNNAGVKAYICAAFGRFAKDEKGEVNVVAIVVLIGIAIVLALIFRDAITNLLNTLFAAIQGNASNAIAP